MHRLPEKTDGFRIFGVGCDFFNEAEFTYAGDFNNDGLDDFLVGTPFADPNGESSGAAFLVYGGIARGSREPVQVNLFNTQFTVFLLMFLHLLITQRVKTGLIK